MSDDDEKCCECEKESSTVIHMCSEHYIEMHREYNRLKKILKENAKLKKQNKILKSYLTDYHDEALEKIKELEREK